MRRTKADISQSSTRVLAIDDEADMLTNYRRMLERAGHECLMATGPDELEKLLAEFHPSIVLTDLMMPNGSGIDVLERVKRFDAQIPVIIITAHGTIETAVEAIQKHAADYITKPFSIEELLKKIQALVSKRLLSQPEPCGAAAPCEPDQRWREGIIGASQAINHVLELVRRVARTDVNVLVVGDSGTGKEVFARAIHRLSARSSEIFVPVDCASLPENLLESELFGYQKGAFTGANSDKMGLFQFAHQGTLFLDEIGEMPTALQSKLLRVLQERCFRPIGGRQQVEIDVRVIAATNRDLEEALNQKTFRSDLYYRLNVVTIRLPPLCERMEDLPLLANHFLRQFARDNRLQVRRISSGALEYLRKYAWPGNVRELQNVIEHAATMAQGESIEPRDLPRNFGVPDSPAAVSIPLAPADQSSGDTSGLFGKKNELVATFERDYLIQLLTDNQFNISKAANAAGCHRRTLYRIIHRQNIDLEVLRQQHEAQSSAVDSQ